MLQFTAAVLGSNFGLALQMEHGLGQRLPKALANGLGLARSQTEAGATIEEAAGVWVLLAVPLLVAGLVRLRGWGPRGWLRAAAWAGAWVSGLAFFGLAVFSAWVWATSAAVPHSCRTPR